MNVVQPGETVMVLDETGRWRWCVRARRCRFTTSRYRVCGSPAIAEFKRGRQWWAYCREHLYGLVVLDGEFWMTFEADWPYEYEVVS